MLKLNILAAAVLAAQAAVAYAQAVPSEIRKDATADAAPADVRPVPREIRKDPAVFYADNPVAGSASRDFSRKERARSADRPAADAARTQPGPAPAEDWNERTRPYLANPY